MKYPYIGVNNSGSKALFFSKDSQHVLHTGDNSSLIAGKSYNSIIPGFYTNITHEYLSNTWGVVESKEHAEFIIELAELNGFKLALGSKSYDGFFVIDNIELGFLGLEKLAKIDFKQITIPLPPKDKDWPQVGDEVYVTKKVLDNNSMQEAAELISETYCKLISKFTHNEVEFCVLKNDNSAYTSLILDLCLSDKTIVKSKPKSKQDLLIEELQTKLCNNNAVDNYILACDIVNGEIEGLSYEGE